jgi:hypothetical protein
MKSRIMYIENKQSLAGGEARIGRVRYSKTGKTLYYGELAFQSLGGRGFKANYFEVNSNQQYWISGPKRRGGDRLYGEAVPIYIDDDVREEYWRDIRKQPERAHETSV